MPACRPTRRPIPQLLAAGALAVLPVALSSCGGGSSAAPTTTAVGYVKGLPDIPEDKIVDLTGKNSVDVEALDNSFSERYIEISAGTQVAFSNAGRNPHNVVPVQPDFEGVPVDSFQPGSRNLVNFTKAGTYAYYCSLHGSAKRGMNGRIIVTG
jgi:plastocyanin